MATKLYVATRKGLFTLERKSTWEIVATDFLGDNLSMLLPDPRDGSLYVALDHGHFGPKLHVKRKGAAAYEELPKPAYPEYPKDKEPEKDGFGRELKWDLKLIWCLEPGGANEPGRLWCGTAPGGVFRSDDSGKSWQLMESLWRDPLRSKWMGGGLNTPGVHSICVDPRDSKHILIGVSCGGVWRTRDGGANWELGGPGLRADFLPPEQQYDPNSQDAHRMVQCPANPEGLWVQHHNGIFKSIDGAKSWTELKDVKPSVFGFAVVVHPKDSETAWFAPAVKDEKRYPLDGKVVVTRTRDGGKTFQVLAKGLPQVHAYDIVFRHCMDIDGTGQQLAMGSSTGGLWISENQGDLWTELSSHLPPIYALRFG